MSLVSQHGREEAFQDQWMPTSPVSGGSLGASAHQELMDSPRGAQLKLHIGLFIAESELICLKLQKL